MIMLGASKPPPLTAYFEMIEGFVLQYTETCWPLIYQAEARFRQEKLSIIQLNEIESLEEAQQNERSYPYDPLQPWGRVYEQATEGAYALKYWHQQVEVRAVLILSRARQLAEYLDGDAQVAAGSSSHIATSYSTPADIGLAEPGARAQKATPPPPTKRPHGGDGAPPAKKTKTAKVKEFHHNVSAGEFSTNRTNRKLCNSFQTSQCTNPACPQAHQCSKCLAMSHGSAECKAVAPQTHKKMGFNNKNGGKGGRKGHK
jgi:hypothetical protein